MKYLLFIRVLTIAVVYLFVNKLNEDFTAPLSIFASIIHELGHTVGALLSGGEVEGFTLAPDCPCLYACTKGGSPVMTLLGGNAMSILVAYFLVYMGRIISKIPQYIFITYLLCALLMFLTVRLIGDDRIISIWMVTIYFLVFLYFILAQSGWAGAFMIFFGFFNLMIILKDIFAEGILSDISRYTRFISFVPHKIWVSIWFGTVGYIAYNLINQISETKVEWIEGKRFFKNTDFDKIILFFSILPNMIGFAFDQLTEFLLIEFKAVFDGIRRFLSI